MRLARKLFLVAAAAIATIAFSAPAANAVEVSAEPSGAHCPEVNVTNDGNHTVTGGCEVHATTEPSTTADLNAHLQTLGEVLLLQCTSEFDVRLHESGNGLIYNQVLSPEGQSPCFLTVCAEPGGTKIPWPANLMEFPVGAGTQEALQLTFCTALGENPPVLCTVYIPLVTGPGAHDYEFGTLAPGPSVPTLGGAPLQSRCSQNAAVSFTGHWEITATPIEIAH